MAFFSWSRWLRSLVRSRVKPIRGRQRFLPRLELLECRLAPATFTWTGLGTAVPISNLWSDPANWQNNNRPLGVSGSEDLVFPTAASQFTNFNDLSNATFNSISFSGGNYTLKGNAVKVGGSTVFTGATGQVNVTGVGTDVMEMNLILGGNGSGQQSFSVGSASSLTLKGTISNAAGVGAGWLKSNRNGSGLMTLSPSSGANLYTEGFTIQSNAGVVLITTNGALGVNNTTTVQENAQLQLASTVGIVNNTLVLAGSGSGSGADGLGALENLAGNNTWAGNIQLTAGATGGPTIGVTLGSLDVPGQISDLGSGASLTKTGPGQMIMSHVGGNTYRGNTLIDNGILTIQDPNSLGNTPTHSSTTTVISNINGVGTLRLDNENLLRFNGTQPGFVVSNEQLVINGVGFAGNGALQNFKGNNTWTGSVTLGSAFNGSNPAIQVLSQGGIATNLLISGTVINPASGGPFGMNKNGLGRLILTNSGNTFTPGIGLVTGFLNIEDSKALSSSFVNVTSGATLELQLQSDNIFGMIPVPKPDSVTGSPNSMTISNTLGIDGRGVGGVGALRNVSGVNAWTGPITLGNFVPTIGVEPDKNPSSTTAYFPVASGAGLVGDWSLTATNLIDNPLNVVGTLTKVGTGQLIIPNASTYGGFTDIKAGWITIENNSSLGPTVAALPQTRQQYTTVESGAALHLEPKVVGGVTQSLSLTNNFILAGLGITHPFGLISGGLIGGAQSGNGGAIESLDGLNSLSGIIQLQGVAGIGAERVLQPAKAAQLTITGDLWDFTAANGTVTVGGITKLGSRRLILESPNTVTGPVDIVNGVVLNQNDTGLGAGGAATSTTTVEASLTTVQKLILNANVTSFTLSLNGGPASLSIPTNSATLRADIESALNALNGGGTAISVVQDSSLVFTITFGGNLTASNQVVSAVRTPVSAPAIIVQTQRYGGGTALELGGTVPSQTTGNAQSGQVAIGIAVWGEHLIVLGTGNTTFNDQAPLVVLSDNTAGAPVVPNNDPYAFLGADYLWDGPVSLSATTQIEVQPKSRLNIYGTIDDAANAAPGGSDLTLMGGGELALLADSTYRGMTNINAGTLTVASSLALGTSGVAAIQTVTLTNPTAGPPASPSTTKFTLTFGSGANTTTAPIPYTGVAATDIAAVSAALTGLNSVNGTADLGGAVTVTEPSPGVFTVVFGGNLLGFAQPTMSALVTAGTGSAAVSVDTAGTGGTVIQNGASLQLQGSITVAGEPLLVHGAGNASAPVVPTQWFSVGPAPINNGEDAGNMPVSGRITGVVSDPNDSGIIYISTAGGGAWKTIDGGKSWHPIFDSIPDIQTVTVPAAAGSFTLGFTGQAPQTIALSSASATLATEMQSALNVLLGAAVGNSTLGNGQALVTVTQKGTAFTVTFRGSLAGVNVPKLTSSNGAVTIAITEVGLDPQFAMYIGAIAMEPGGANSKTIYLGTGETNNSSDSYYGTGVYKSTDGGSTWSLMYGNEIQGILVQGKNLGTSTFDLSFTAPDATGATVTQTANGLAITSTDVAVANALNAFTNIGGVGGSVTVTHTLVQEIQQFAVINGNTGNSPTFTLTFNGTTTAALAYNATAATVQAELDTDFGVGAMQVTAWLNTNPALGAPGFESVYTIYFNTAFFPYQQPLITIQSMGVGVVGPTEVQAGGVQYYVTFGGTLAQMTPPLLVATATAGGTITILPVVNRSTPANPFYGKGISQINAAGNGNLYVADGDGGTGISEQQTLQFRGFPSLADKFTLSFTGADINGNVLTLTTPVLTYFHTSNGGTTTSYNPDALNIATEIQTNLIALANIGGVGGTVSVVAAKAKKGFSGLFTITFGGTLSAKSLPALKTNFPSPPANPPTIEVKITVPGGPATVVNGSGGAAGIWRFLSANATWFNLTNLTSRNRSSVASATDGDTVYGPKGTLAGFPYTPGPDDDYRISFPTVSTSPFLGVPFATNPNGTTQFGALNGGFGVPLDESGATWTGVQTLVSFNPNTNSFQTILFAALGFSSGGPNPGNNGVFWSPDFAVATQTAPPTWYVGNPFDGSNPPKLIPDIENGGEFPTGAGGAAINGNIKFFGVGGGGNATGVVSNSLLNGPANTARANEGFITVYAAVANPNGSFQNVYKTSNGGFTWTAVGAGLSNYMSVSGAYANAIVTVDQNTAYVGSTVTAANAGTGTGQIFRTTNSGGLWSDISVAAGNGPHSSQHAMSVDANGRILVGGDGGLFRYNPAGTSSWTDLNGDLAISQMTAVASAPTNSFSLIAGAQYLGTEQFSNNQAWNTVDASTALGIQGGGAVYIDPTNPNNMYAVQTTLQTFGSVRRSTNGGATWSTILANPTIRSTIVALVMDPINPKRLFVGAQNNIGVPTLFLSVNGGTTFSQTLNPPTISSVKIIAIPEYQGTFVADADFTDVPDAGANSTDSDTIYVTDGTSIQLTKNHGITWADRSIPTVAGGIIDLRVDPTNRDTLYAVVNTFGNNLYESIDAGLTWTEIGTAYGLPAVPAWKLAIDPRTGTLYVGTDIGVYQMVGGMQFDRANNFPTTPNTWQPAGIGMPNVQIRDLVLNQVTNTLIAATYGRSVFELFLDAPQVAPIALNVGTGFYVPNPITSPVSVLSGSVEWAGPVVLDTNAGKFAVYGNPGAPDPISTAQLNIVGTIGDLVPGSTPQLTKVGQGTLVLSGTNVYGGDTLIQEGVIIADNLFALGSTARGTTVLAGTALKLESSVAAEPLFLNGDGPINSFDEITGLSKPATFNGHNTGALESIANFNTYAGKITLQTSSTIGVDTGSQLTLIGDIVEAPLASGFTLTKELAGTLILADNNSYTGATYVNQGALQVQSSGALDQSLRTYVLDGAALQLFSPVGGPGVSINEPLSLSGTGINNTGALVNSSGNNTWRGNITLDANPGFASLTLALGIVPISVDNALDVLTISGVVQEDAALPGLRSGLRLIGDGTLVLDNTNTYTGTTYIDSGTLRMKNARALGGAAGAGQVQNEIQRLTYFDPSYDPTLGAPNGNGQFSLSFNSVPITSLQTSGVSAASLQAALNSIPALNGNVSVSMVQVVAPVAGAPLPTLTEVIYTIVFQGALAGLDVPQLVLSTIGGATGIISNVADGGTGARVQDGAALALDLAASPTGQTVTGVALHLNGNGPSGLGALENITGNNTWQGVALIANPNIPAITLSTSSAIGVDAGTTLTVRGATSDATGATGIDGAATAALSKIGGGTLNFNKINRYAGTTQIQNGIINLNGATANNALGQALSNEIQTLTINGSINGSFRVTFNGATTPDISADYTGPNTLSELKTQLAALPTIGGAVDVNVHVTQSANVFTITFIGALGGQVQNLLEILPGDVTPGTTVAIAEQTPGALGYTIVSGGIAIAFQGGLMHASQFPLIPDTTNLVGTNAVVTPTISVATTTVGNATTNAVQTLYFNETVTGGTFTLAYNDGATLIPTAPIAWSSDPATLVANIQNALDNSAVGAGNFVVSAAAPGALQLQGGVTLKTEELILSGAGPAGNGALENVSGNNSVLPATAIVAPNSQPPTSPIILNGDTTIGSDAGTLTIGQTIAELVPSSDLTKVGPGTLLMNDTAALHTPNSYTGLTTVVAGTLELGKVGGTADVDIPADLVVGLPGGTVNAVAQFVQSNQLQSTANVTVNSAKGLFDINGKSQNDIDTLTVNDGTAQTGSGGLLGVDGLLTINDGLVQIAAATGIIGAYGGLAMKGGVLNTGTSSVATVVLGSDVVATSDAATGPATVTGTGILSLGGADRFFTVNPGTGSPVDMDVQAPVGSAGGEGLHKEGAGSLQLDAPNYPTAAGLTTVDAGSLYVTAPNGTIDNAVVNAGLLVVGGTAQHIRVNGGTAKVDGVAQAVDLHGANAVLAGGGSVANIDNGAAGTAPVGTINPGSVSTPTPIGALTTNTVAGGEVWGPNTRFFVDLVDAATYDTLIVNGPLDLGGTFVSGGGQPNGGAVLAGFVGPNVNLGDTFTIIQHIGAGAITNIFQESFSNNVAFVGGQKFSVEYNANFVKLTRVINSATLSATSSANPSVYGQHFTITAILTPELGVSAPFAGTIDFTLHLPGGGTLTQFGVPVAANGRATIDPVALFGSLAPGSYTVDAAYSGDGNYMAIPTVTNLLVPAQVVNQSGTTVTLTGPGSAPLFGQPVNVTATVQPSGQGQGTPSGTVSFFVDGNPYSGNPVSLPAGQNTVGITLTGLIVGSHTITATYNGDTNFTTSSTAPPQLVVNVAKDQSLMTLSAFTSTANPASSSVFHQVVTFTATVTAVPPSGSSTVVTPTPGNVTFFRGGTAIGSVPVSFDSTNNVYVANLPISTLPVGIYTITATYGGNTQLASSSANLNNVSVNNFTVNKISTSTAISLTSGNNPSLFGDPLQFTATVMAVAPGSGTPDGTVTFTDTIGASTTSLGTVTLSFGSAFVNVSNLSAGVHTITATYNGTSDYAGGSDSVQQQVGQLTTTKLTSSVNPVIAGNTVTFTAAVAPAPGAPPSSPVPTGTVIFYIDGGTAGGGSQSSSISLDGTGHASYPTNALALGDHTVKAEYTPTGTTYVTSFDTITETVISGSTVNVVLLTGTNPSVFSQPLTFQATVAASAPGAPTPTGSVTFVINGGPGNGGSQQTIGLSGGHANLVISNLPIGSNTITATYGGDPVTAPSATTSSVNQTVNQAPTQTVVTSSSNPAAIGTALTFTITVTPTMGATATPTGLVTLVITNASTGISEFQRTVGLTNGTATVNVGVLSPGAHNVFATYTNTDGKFVNSQSATVRQTVVSPSQTSLIASPNPSVAGKPVTLTATVSHATGTAALTGTVTFFDDTTSTNLGTSPLVGATATLSNVTFATFGVHALRAVYSGNDNYGPSTGPRNLNVLRASTVTVAPSGMDPAAYGTSLTFTATVAANPVGPIPTGTVTFFDGAKNLGTRTLAGGTVDLTIATLAVGTHNITATYSGDSVVGAGGTTASVSQTITQAISSMTPLTSSMNPSSLGQSVTFTATVGAPGSVIPSGTVNFVFDNGSSNPVALNANGVASFSTNALSKGLHHLVATYTDPAGNFAGSSSTLDQNVLVGTTTTLSMSPSSPVFFNTPVTLSATVNFPSTSGPIGGTVHFVDTTSGTDFGFVAVDAVTGKAQVPTAVMFSTGAHHLTATYSGDTTFVGSVGALDLVSRSNTAVGLVQTAGSNPSVFSETLTYQATVTANDGSVPTGSVGFYFQGGLLTTVPLTPGANSSTASASFSNLVSGRSAYLFTAQYNGTAFLLPATSPVISQTINVDPTITTLVSSAPTSSYGQNVTWTATVMQTGAATQVPTGTVNIQIDNGNVHSVALVNGTASFSAPNVTAGPHTVVATYLGLAQKFAGSMGSVSQQVNPASTSTMVTSNANPSGAGQTVTFTATVQNMSGSIVPTGGTVTFTVDNVDQAPVALTNGIATFATGSLTFGSHGIQARYNGAPNFSASAPSAVLTQVVNIASQTTLTTSRNPSSAGDPVTFTATVTHSSGAPALTGAVNFYDGSIFLATQPLNGNQAIFTTSALAVGTHTIVAKYTGDSNYAVSRGIVTQQVNTPVASIMAVLTSPPANNDGVNNPFRIDGYARDANGNATAPPSPTLATLSIVSGPGTFKSGNTSTGFSGGSWAFQNLTLTAGGVYTLRITYGSFTADIVIDTGRLT